MKRTVLAALSFFFVAAMLFLNMPNARAEENVIVYGEYLTDSDGYDYGVDYFVDSGVNAQIYVAPYIIARENVTGSLISGVLLMEPNEIHVRIGSFISSDHSKPWSVTVGAKWKRTE